MSKRPHSPSFDYVPGSTQPADKGRGIAQIVADGRCFATAKPEIDAERAKCRLLCRNCHNTRHQWDV